jgi:hypothetical protein
MICDICGKKCKSTAGLGLHKLYKHTDYVRPPLTDKQESNRTKHIIETYSNQEIRDKVSNATKEGMANADLTERNEKISKSNKGRVISDDAKTKMSKSHIKLWKDDDYRNSMIASIKRFHKENPHFWSTSIEVECDYCGKIITKIPSLIEKSNHHFCDRICYAKWQSDNEDFKGTNNPAWKGGVTPKNKSDRTGRSMREWRESVFERDGYICQICCKKGVYLEAHHIKPFAKYPELRFDVDNGITLCAKCHKKIHVWMGIK